VLGQRRTAGRRASLSFTAAGRQAARKWLAGSITGDALFAEMSGPAAGVVVLTVISTKATWPFRTAFPILSPYAQRSRGVAGELQEALPTGATAEVNVPSVRLDSGTCLTAPDGGAQKLPHGGSRFTLGRWIQAASVVPSTRRLLNAPSALCVQHYEPRRHIFFVRAELAAVHLRRRHLGWFFGAGFLGGRIWFVLIAVRGCL